MNIVCAFIIWVYSTTMLSAEWTLGDSTLNDANHMLGATVLNNSLHIISNINQDEYELDPLTKSITYLGSTSTGADNYIWGQYWTQTGIMVYIINGGTNKLSTFNMLTKQWTNDWGNAFLYAVDYYGCIASSDTEVFLVGGRPGYIDDTWKYVQIMTLSTGAWSATNPQMKIGRSSQGCLVAGDYLWAFGGTNVVSGTKTLLSSAERLSLQGVLSFNQWNYIDPLTVALQEARAVAFGDSVFVIGGSPTEGFSTSYVDTVHIYNVADGSVVLSPYALVYAVNAPGVVVKNNVIYVFGGKTASGYTDQWMYLEIPTPEPTAAPITSTEPTAAPSKAPSKYPTEAPSEAPSKNPSHDPSVAPSEMPSQTPSEAPSKNPTQAPSSDPTVAPSAVPSQAPSNNPSQVPSNAPSESPRTTMADEKEGSRGPMWFENVIVLIFIGGVFVPLLLIAIFCLVNHKDDIKKCCCRIAGTDTDDAALQNAIEMDAQLEQMDGDMPNAGGDLQEVQVHKDETPEADEGDKGTVEGGGRVVIEGAVKTRKQSEGTGKTKKKAAAKETGGTTTGDGDEEAAVTGNEPMHTSGAAVADV